MKMNMVEKAICTFLEISRLRAIGNLSWRDATEHLGGKMEPEMSSRVIHSPSRVIHSHGGQGKKTKGEISRRKTI